MAWLRKKSDPISDRARVLNSEIAELEAQIKKLDARLQRKHSDPRWRPTAVPHGATLQHPSHSPEPPPSRGPAAHDPIFEDVDQDRLQPGAERSEERRAG